MKSDDLSMDLCFMIMRLQLRYIWHKLPISCWTVPRGAVKAVLLKLLLMQELKNGAVVCIADFKGGVDFPTGPGITNARFVLMRTRCWSC